jgi:uncharacterized protein (UPF0333 family)
LGNLLYAKELSIKRMDNKKAQVATEYVIMLGVLLTIVAGLAGYSLVMYSETVSLNQTKDALRDLKTAANRVYDLGEGNSKIVEIYFPNGVTEARVVGKAIYVTSTSFGSSVQDFVETDANVHGTLSITQGTHYIEVKAVDGNVSISET